MTLYYKNNRARLLIFSYTSMKFTENQRNDIWETSFSSARVIVFAKIWKNKIRKNEYKDNNYFSSRRFDHWVLPHIPLKLKRRDLAAALSWVLRLLLCDRNWWNLKVYIKLSGNQGYKKFEQALEALMRSWPWVSKLWQIYGSVWLNDQSTKRRSLGPETINRRKTEKNGAVWEKLECVWDRWAVALSD